jgi:hypothetical protein
MNRAVRLASWFAAFPLVTSLAFAQDTASLASRLDKPTYTAVAAIVDSARAARLPTKPLLDKAFEGAAKGSDGTKIVAAVQLLSIRMGSAKNGLGARASADEIRAATGALEAGVSVPYLAKLRSASGRRPLTMPLAVVTDLIARTVPIPTATDLVLQLARSGIADADLALFQRNVRADIDRGADPTAAATTRARGLVVRLGAAPKPSSLE